MCKLCKSSRLSADLSFKCPYLCYRNEKDQTIPSRLLVMDPSTACAKRSTSNWKCCARRRRIQPWHGKTRAKPGTMATNFSKFLQIVSCRCWHRHLLPRISAKQRWRKDNSRERYFRSRRPTNRSRASQHQGSRTQITESSVASHVSPCVTQKCIDWTQNIQNIQNILKIKCIMKLKTQVYNQSQLILIDLNWFYFYT